METPIPTEEEFVALLAKHYATRFHFHAHLRSLSLTDARNFSWERIADQIDYKLGDTHDRLFRAAYVLWKYQTGRFET